MQVRQAANVVDLLEFFARRGASATFAEIADGLGWPRSSTFNLVSTLVDKGCFYEPEQRGSFYPSPKWLSLAQDFEKNDPLPEALRLLVDCVGNETGETTAIGARSSQSVIFLYVSESRRPIRYNAEVGTTVPLHASSAGRAILSLLTDAEKSAYFRKLNFEQFSETSPMNIQQVEDEILAAKARGYHQSIAEYIPDLAGVALPVVYGGRRLSIVVAGPVSRCLSQRGQIAVTIQSEMKKFKLTTE